MYYYFNLILLFHSFYVLKYSISPSYICKKYKNSKIPQLDSNKKLELLSIWIIFLSHIIHKIIIKTM